MVQTFCPDLTAFFGAAIAFASFGRAFDAIAGVTTGVRLGTVLAFVANFGTEVQGTLAWVTSRWAILTSLTERFAAVIFLGAAITLAALSGTF